MSKQLNDIVRAICAGDTSQVEGFFRQPGGRKYLEQLTLILINTLPNHIEEKKELYRGFVSVLDALETRIRRQKEGQEVLDSVFNTN